MKNKSKKIYGRLSALFLSTVLIMTGLSVTALAAGENLITDAYFDPTFETLVLPEANASGVSKDKYYAIKYGELATDGGKSGANYLKLTQSDGYISMFAPVEPAKNYHFSFWMRNSLEKVLELSQCTFYSTANDSFETATSMLNSTSYSYDYGKNAFNMTFGNRDNVNTPTIDAERNKFGIARTGGEENVWRQVTIDFSTPPTYEGDANPVTHVELVLKCLQADEKLAIDDLSVVETGKKPNRIFGGYFEAIQKDKETEDVSGVFYSFKNSGNATLEVCEDDGNHYLKLACVDGVTDPQNFQIFSKNAIRLQGVKAGTRYKLSLKAKAVHVDGEPSTKNVVLFELQKSKGTDYGSFTFPDPTNEWQTYNYYIDATVAAKRGSAIGPHSNANIQMSAFVLDIAPGYEIYLDDLSAWYDESGIGFYKTLTFNSQGGERRFEVKKDDLGNVFFKSDDQDVFMAETAVEAASLDSLGTGERTLTVRAHYLPEQTWGEWDDSLKTYPDFNVEKNKEITLLSAVYKYVNGKKTLHEVFVDSETVENGETIDVVTEVTVPEATNGETYTVEAMAWDMSTMKPVMDKAVLE